MGFCGLHIVKNGFKVGIVATGWNVVIFLKSVFTVFKDIPAQRSNYSSYSNSLQYSSTKWLQNSADLKSIFIKKEVLEKSNNINNIEIESTDNYIKTHSVKHGFAVQVELNKLNKTETDVSDKDELHFKSQCQTMAIKFCKKLLEKSTLKYKLCKGITFCDPMLFYQFNDSCLKRLQLTLEEFLKKNRISTRDCDIIEKDVKKLIKKIFKISLKNYDKNRIHVNNDCFPKGIKNAQNKCF